MTSKEIFMPTQHPRVTVTFNKNDAEIIQIICMKKKISKSRLIRQIMENWLKKYENMLLSQKSDKIEELWQKEGSKTISHENFWRNLNLE
jgi:hypothetical protein